MKPWHDRIFQIRRPVPLFIYLCAAATAFLIPLLAWWILTATNAVDPIFLPSPAGVKATFNTLWDKGRFQTDVSMSVYRVTIGFLVAAAAAIPLGLLMGTFHIIEGLIEPIVNFIRYMPAAAFIPLIMLYIGIGEDAKMTIIFIGSFFQLIILVAAVARSVPHEMIQVAYTLGYARSGVLGRVIIPASLPGIIENFRIVLGWAWTYVIVAEFIAAEEGLGYRILQSQRFLKTETIFLYILVIGILGLIFDQVIKYFSRWALPWAEGFEK